MSAERRRALEYYALILEGWDYAVRMARFWPAGSHWHDAVRSGLAQLEMAERINGWVFSP